MGTFTPYEEPEILSRLLLLYLGTHQRIFGGET